MCRFLFESAALFIGGFLPFGSVQVCSGYLADGSAPPVFDSPEAHFGLLNGVEPVDYSSRFRKAARAFT